MMQKRTSHDRAAPLSVVLITLDNHMSAAVERARQHLKADLPSVTLKVHAAADWANKPESLVRCKTDIASGDIIIVSMLFIEDHVKAVADDLAARHQACDAMVCCMSSGEIMKFTTMGRFKMADGGKGPLALLKKLRGDGGKKKATSSKTAGERQLAMLRRLPKILKYVPGTAQDIRNYFLTLQYRVAASDENVANMVRLLVSKYANGPRRDLRKHLTIGEPLDYPETGVYHPEMEPRLDRTIAALPFKEGAKGTIGILLLRTYILTGDTQHYDHVIRAYEAAGFNVVPVFSSGLDMRLAIKRFLSGGG